jgi:hypothetical protein
MNIISEYQVTELHEIICEYQVTDMRGYIHE